MPFLSPNKVRQNNGFGYAFLCVFALHGIFLMAGNQAKRHVLRNQFYAFHNLYLFAYFFYLF